MTFYRSLASAIFLIGPFRFGRLGFALERSFSRPWTAYRCLAWRSVSVFGLRFYWWARVVQQEPKTGQSLEDRVAEWVRSRIGEANLHRRERAMRLLEEASLRLVRVDGTGCSTSQLERLSGSKPSQ